MRYDKIGWNVKLLWSNYKALENEISSTIIIWEGNLYFNIGWSKEFRESEELESEKLFLKKKHRLYRLDFPSLADLKSLENLKNYIWDVSPWQTRWYRTNLPSPADLEISRIQKTETGKSVFEPEQMIQNQFAFSGWSGNQKNLENWEPEKIVLAIP